MSQVRGMFVLFTFALGVLTPILLTPRLGGQSLVSWTKKEVVPIVIVKPFMGRFVPDDETSIGIFWDKEDVVPMCPVKPDIAGFSPVKGNSIGNTWPKDEVKPFVIVQPGIGGFVPVAR